MGVSAQAIRRQVREDKTHSMADGPDSTGGAASAGDPLPSSDASSRETQRLARGSDIAAVAIGLFMLITVYTMSTSRLKWPGDQYTDMNTLMSGENFATHGLFRLKLLPVFHVGAMTDPPSYYTHYPPLTNVANGLLRMAGIEALSAMRVFCGLLGMAGLVCMYRAFAPDVGPVAAACGLGFLATTGFFFTYCISLHHTFNILFLGVFLVFFTRAVRSEAPALGLWVGCWIVLMLESLTSFEFILYPQVFAWVYVLATGRIRRHWRVLIVLATAPVAGVGLHFLQNCWALGLSAATADALGALDTATGARGPGRWFYSRQVPGFILSNGQQLYYQSWPVLLVVPPALAVWVAAREPTLGAGRGRRAVLLAALVASLAWYVFMPSHTAHHPHTMSQLLPLVFVVMGGTIAVIVQWLVARQAPVYKRALAGAAALVVVLGQAWGVYTSLRQASHPQPQLYHLFEAMGDTAFPPDAAVLTNSSADAQLAYFIRRPVWRCPIPELPLDPGSLASLQKRLSDDWRIAYYILSKTNNRELFETLASTCPGRGVGFQAGRTRHVVIVFEISRLVVPPDQRRPLQPDVRQHQLDNRFPQWDPPGFHERLRQMGIGRPQP